jgi:hypothetical protein
METMRTRKIELYANGVEIQKGDHQIAKEILIGMSKFRGKLSNYGALKESKQNTLPKTKGYSEVERFIVEDFEFIVVTIESMSFNMYTMELSEPRLGTEVYWQRIK